jgi:NADH-quinone oxidoreductase subunit G
MHNEKIMIIDGMEIGFDQERNVLEVIRKANIDLPTFCYHSELSVYGACRLCLVDVEGKGIVSSCSLLPEAGMKVKTNTKEIREIRKISIELLLASHDQECNTCYKSSSCKLQELANRFGIDEVRFKRTPKNKEIDASSHALIRDTSKCILCGDCVRACEEIQGIGAINFAYRGSQASIIPAFGNKLADTDCIDCGQCARVCPTGAIVPKPEIDEVWDAIDNPNKHVVVHFAPAVRVAIGESFGMAPGSVLTGQIVAALKMLGFNQVFDTSFAADLTVIEETHEFINRKKEGVNLPLFTSCCPGWVKFAEQNFPDMLDNLSTCRSPQQMFGSVAKRTLSEQLQKDPKDIIVVSIMPCTAKKFEARRPEFSKDNVPETDYVITTQELAQMIKRAGIKFESLTPQSLDLPFGFKTGAGVLFGNSGGVTEAVLRYAAELITGNPLANDDFHSVRGEDGIREVELKINGDVYRLAVVHSLKNAKKLVQDIKNGTKKFDLVEVMACPGGCIGGAGQPVSFDPDIKQHRTKGLYSADKMLQLHKSQENPYITKLYGTLLGSPGSHAAHSLLHTSYTNRKQVVDDKLCKILTDDSGKIEVKVCVGTNCHLKQAQTLLNRLIVFVNNNGLKNLVEVRPTFCMDRCQDGPNVSVAGVLSTNSSYQKIVALIRSEINHRIENTVQETV